MSEFWMKTEHRGLLETIMFTVMRRISNFDLITSDPVVINNMAEVILRLQAVEEPEYHIELNIRFKKNKSAKETVYINIMVDDFNQHFKCHNEWLEVSICKIKHLSELNVDAAWILLYLKRFYIVVSSSPTLSDKLYNETDSTDFKLQGTDGSVPVHKSVLWVCSEMFRTMFRGDWKETDEDSIDMPGVSAQTLQHLKDYMYLGIVPDDGLESLLVLARRCLMHELAESCIEKLIRSVKASMPELVKGLIMRIPDEVVTGITNLSIDKEKSNDTK